MRRTLYAKLGIILTLLLVAGIVYLRLIAGPVSLNDYTKGVGDALAGRIGPGWRVAFNDTALELQGTTPAVRAAGLEIRNPGGIVVVRAPLAVVSVDAMSLLTGNIALRAIELRDLQIRALVARDGSLSFVPQGETDPVPPPPDSAAAAPPAPQGSPVSQALASLLQPVLAPNGVVGALDRAIVTNARVTLIGADGRERVGFSRVGARFEQMGAGKREIALDLEGPHGVWRVGGTAQESKEGVQSLQLSVSDVPLADTLLLAGLSGLPDGSDLKLSAEFSASLQDRRLTALGGRFWSRDGVIELPDKNLRFLHVEQLAGSATWDEAARALSLTNLLWANGPTRIQLAAAMTQGAEPRAWALDFSGRDAVLSGASGGDAPVKIDTVGGRLRFKDTGLTLENLSVVGPALDASLSGTFEGGDKKELRADLQAQRTGARNLLRLWPETINPDLRRYVDTSLKGGTVDTLRMTTVLDEPDLHAAFGSAPVTDGAIKLSASLSNATLVPAPGMPPLVGLSIEGRATGTTATMTGREARLELPDGRRLRLSDGSYRQVDTTSPGSTAYIAFRLGGGADALASLLRLPQFHDAANFEFDPAAVKGNVDLRVSLPLQYDRMPKSAADVAVSVVGALSDITIDKVYGREKLEGANLTLTSDPTGLFVKGEGKLSGSPSTIDLRQPRGAPGEITVNASLDEAARTRRSLPVSPQLAGVVAVKVTAPLGPPAAGAKPTARVEADLARASVDGLVPGWTKPAGKPGRVTFALADGDGRDLRDFVIDSGTVQLRGNLALAEDGGLERAEFASLKLSPGDDMRAQIDRSGALYRVAIKGNVGDARPLIKQITAGPAAAAPAAKGRETAREGAEVDLDLALNIMTGNNDEAMTGVTSKVSVRRGELRALTFNGRFRGAPVEAQLSPRAGAAPSLTLQTSDAGATLRFLDIYKRMLGGRLVLNAAIGSAGQAGTVKIDQFALKNEPALRRIFAQGPPSASEERGGSQAPQSDADQVYFTKLVGGFERTQSRMDYKDVVIYGAQVGFTLSGFVDNARDRTDIHGTFVPAYGLNNAFSQVPIVGLILGGGNTNEGLFAVDFRISGPASSPTLNVNPLSAVAPGILRKLFGWALQGGDDVPTGTTAPRSSER
jgi:hypothetical protein